MTVPSLRPFGRGYSMVIMGMFMASCLMILFWLDHGYFLQTDTLEASGSIKHEYAVTGGHRKAHGRPRKNNEETKTSAPIANTTQGNVAAENFDLPSYTSACTVEERRTIVKEVCSTLSDRYLAVKADEYHDVFHTFINHEQRIFCRIVSKAGSQALHGYFSRLNKLDASYVAQATVKDGLRINLMPRLDFGSVPADDIMNLKGFNRIVNVSLSEVQRLFHNYTKLIQVRHPLQRFVSGYYEKVFQKIPNPNFSVFVEEVLNGRSNGHWMPYYTNTYPCVLHYDIIMKVETSKLDQFMLKDRFGWESTIDHGHINPNFNMTGRTRSVYYKYDDFLKDFEMKHLSWFNRLLAFLQPDMDMFGYFWDEAGSSCYNSAAKCC